ncbi:MAG: hypothetical protein V5A62_11015 [Haloarculaceae archaeon]
MPDEGAVTLTTDDDGAVTVDDGDSLGGDVVGEWSIGVVPPDGHAIADEAGTLDPDALGDVHVVVEYGYDWPE